MKIASRIHPRNGAVRNVTIHGKPYAFKRTQDTFGDEHFVADVVHEAHAETLLGSDAFYRFDPDTLQQPALVKPAPAPTTEPPAGGLTVLAFPADVMTQAETLLNGSASAIGADVGQVKSLAVVKAALAIEQASVKPRGNVITLLTKTLEGAAAAGVTA